MDDGAHMAQHLLQTIVALAVPNWCGTATDLLAALPEHLRPASAVVLARLLRASEVELLAAGVTMTAKRQPKTGARLLRLSVLPSPLMSNLQSAVEVQNSTSGLKGAPPPAAPEPCRRRAIFAARAARGEL